jgi:hypothetical protein
MVAIQEIHTDHMIVSFGRNKKGFIDISKCAEEAAHFKVGNFVLATVVSTNKAEYRKESGNLNRKAQLTLSVEVFNTNLMKEHVYPNAVLPGIVEVSEDGEKSIDFKMSDETKGKVKGSNKYKSGSLVYVRVLSTDDGIECEIIEDTFYTHSAAIKKGSLLPFECVKPGFYTQCEIVHKLDNGVKVKLFKHHVGYIFVDHLNKYLENYKETDKV